MYIRSSALGDIPDIVMVYEEARSFMRANGNMTQWTNGYPSGDVILKDIRSGNSYVCIDDGQIAGVFSLIMGEDPTYVKIYDGQWLNNQPYGTVHRIAVHLHNRGVATFCLDWCYTKSGNLRIDTHRDNIAMQKLVLKNGFTYCGIIHLLDGSPRLAYQK